MAGLDTNVLVRWLVADDDTQTVQVQALLESGRSAGTAFFVPTTVLLELELTVDAQAARLPQVELIGG